MVAADEACGLWHLPAEYPSHHYLQNRLVNLSTSANSQSIRTTYSTWLRLVRLIKFGHSYHCTVTFGMHSQDDAHSIHRHVEGIDLSDAIRRRHMAGSTQICACLYA